MFLGGDSGHRGLKWGQETGVATNWTSDENPCLWQVFDGSLAEFPDRVRYQLSFSTD